MSVKHAMTRRRVLALAGTSLLGVWSAQALDGNEGDKSPSAEPEAIVGRWNATERHKSHGSLYQPNHEARKRDAVIYIEQAGDRLTGMSETPNYREISGQGNWNGRTHLKQVRFSDNKLVFEIDIAQWDPKLAPLSDDLKRTNHKGTIRVEAQLKGDKLIGKWGVFTKQGTEIFRGEWAAVRAERQEKGTVR